MSSWALGFYSLTWKSLEGFEASNGMTDMSVENTFKEDKRLRKQVRMLCNCPGEKDGDLDRSMEVGGETSLDFGYIFEVLLTRLLDG